ncbi:MAG: endonuclease/exonuclease/phosphatase family protein [Sphingomonadaceae bacterium]|nr:endonuclease/exonuclease/phosphatase family protein [Sphingomonadaceae bacterium]
MLAAARHAVAEAGPPLLAVSYNIRKAMGTDGRRDPARVLDVLAEIGPDVVVLQEADRRFGERASVLPADLIAAYGFRSVPVAAHDASLGWRGNAILVSRRVAVLRYRTLPLPSIEPRGAVFAELAFGGRLFRVVGMHLDLSGLMRRRQLAIVLERMAAEPGELPTLVMGDLNAWRQAAFADLARGLHPVPLGPSFPSRLPLGRLDRIYVNDLVRVIEAGVHGSARARVASDHLPVWLRLGLAGRPER